MGSRSAFLTRWSDDSLVAVCIIITQTIIAAGSSAIIIVDDRRPIEVTWDYLFYTCGLLGGRSPHSPLFRLIRQTHRPHPRTSDAGCCRAIFAIFTIVSSPDHLILCPVIAHLMFIRLIRLTIFHFTSLLSLHTFQNQDHHWTPVGCYMIWTSAMEDDDGGRQVASFWSSGVSAVLSCCGDSRQQKVHDFLRRLTLISQISLQLLTLFDDELIWSHGTPAACRMVDSLVTIWCASDDWINYHSRLRCWSVFAFFAKICIFCWASLGQNHHQFSRYVSDLLRSSGFYQMVINDQTDHDWVADEIYYSGREMAMRWQTHHHSTSGLAATSGLQRQLISRARASEAWAEHACYIGVAMLSVVACAMMSTMIWSVDGDYLITDARWNRLDDLDTTCFTMLWRIYLIARYGADDFADFELFVVLMFYYLLQQIRFNY